jgi:general secretion pathway protein A
MYTQHFRLTELPFSIAPNPRYLYLSPQHREALAHLLYGIGVGGGFVVLTGEVGTGKTTLCRALLEQLPEDVDIALIFNPRLNSRELLAGICDELHIPYAGPKASLKQLIDALNQYLLESHARGRRVIVLIDEAQNLRFDVLEQVRLLTNLETNQAKLLQIILVGQPELNQILDRPNLRQLSQRITARYHLNPLSLSETRDYIHHRMTVASGLKEVFTRSAIRTIHRKARGIPRLINLMADRALLGAYTLGKQRVSAGVARRATDELMSGSPKAKYRRLAGLLLLVISLLAGVYYLDILPLPWVRVIGPVETLSEGIKPASNVPTENNAPVEPPQPLLKDPNSDRPQQESAKEEKDNPTADSPQFAEWIASPKKNWPNAMKSLLGEWSVTIPDPHEDACALAAEHGIRCQPIQSSWIQIKNINLPVVLEFVLPDGHKRYALVKGVVGNWVEMVLADDSKKFAERDLLPLWTGATTVAWKPGQAETKTLKSGDRSPLVAWVRQRLGVAAPSEAETFYDELLREKVTAFQSSRGLKPDGIIGTLTFLSLQTAGPSVGIPRLSPVAP